MGAFDSNANQCTPGKVIQQATLEAGIKAGKYIEGNDVSKEEECAEQCCSEAQCDVAFLLGSKCFLVICSNIASCRMVPARNSALDPRLIYVTRKNSEGVIKTMFSEDQKEPWNPNICPPMVALDKVTLKGGLAAGKFTDIGPVASLQQCYDLCCQKRRCDLAFMLASNCFTVDCHDKLNQTGDSCLLEQAVDSPFNPEAAHILSRIDPKEGELGVQSAWANEDLKTIPSTTTSMPMTIGPQATFQEVSIPLQKSPYQQPFAYNPLQLPPPMPYNYDFNPPTNYMPDMLFGNFNPYGNSLGLVQGMVTEQPKELMKGYFTLDANKLAQSYMASAGNGVTTKLTPPKSSPIPDYLSSECQFTPVYINTSLKFGKKAGKFVKANGIIQDVDACSKACCLTKNSTFTCEVAFFASKTCFFVDCYDQKSCQKNETPPSTYNPHLVYVRNILDATPPKLTTIRSTTHAKIHTTTPRSSTRTKSVDQSKKTTPKPEVATERNCHHGQILTEMTVQGAAQTFESRSVYKENTKNSARLLADNIKNMRECTDLCCDDLNCDAAVLQGGSCLAVNCAENSRACVPVVVKSTSIKDTQLAFMSRSDDSYRKKMFQKNLLFGALGLGSALFIAVVTIATVISAKFIRGKKTVFKKKTQRANRNGGRIADQNKTEEEAEQDRLEELLSRGTLSSIQL